VVEKLKPLLSNEAKKTRKRKCRKALRDMSAEALIFSNPNP